MPVGVARTRASFARARPVLGAARMDAGSICHQKPPQIPPTEVVEQAGEAWLSHANAGNAPGEQVSGVGPLDTIPQDDTTDA